MEEFDKIASDRKKIGNEMEDLMDNIKKDSPSERTLAHWEKRLKHIDELYKISSQNYKRLIFLNTHNHSYSTTRYFQQIIDLYS